MIERARALAKPVLVDPKGTDWSRYHGATVDHAQPRRAGAGDRQLGRRRRSSSERVQALRRLHGIDAVVLTRAEEGMSLFDGAGQLHVPAQAREVFDVTGAGDTVIAALAAMLAAGLPLREAMPIANRAGGIVVGKFGTASVGYDELFATGAGA